MSVIESVVVLLSSYNGEKYINEQIESLVHQDYQKVMILVRDDGSQDRTESILRKWSQTTSRIKVQLDTNCGYKRSFLEMLYTAPEADIYMFCDQDDVWEQDKIRVAVESLKDRKLPAIYTSNVKYCTADLKETGTSHFNDNAEVWKALLYNQAVGCTIAMNQKLREQIMKVPLEKVDLDNIYSHDCWVYRICAVLGGDCIFDNESHILYRQHGNNQIGGSASFWGKWKNRLKKIGDRHIKKNLAMELEKCYGKFISDEAVKEAVHAIAHYGNLRSKYSILKHREIYTHNFFDNLGVMFAILFSVA